MIEIFFQKNNYMYKKLCILKLLFQNFGKPYQSGWTQSGDLGTKHNLFYLFLKNKNLKHRKRFFIFINICNMGIFANALICIVYVVEYRLLLLKKLLGYSWFEDHILQKKNHIIEFIVIFINFNFFNYSNWENWWICQQQ